MGTTGLPVGLHFIDVMVSFSLTHMGYVFIVLRCKDNSHLIHFDLFQEKQVLINFITRDMM
jgi:hypothetical protein